MTGGPLQGIRVLEVAMYGFVPSAGAVLGEWGADVIKVEHAVTGDPQRGLRQTGPLRVEGDPNPNIEHANRGKRSIGLDMSVPEGREILLELAKNEPIREIWIGLDGCTDGTGERVKETIRMSNVQCPISNVQGRKNPPGPGRRLRSGRSAD